MGRVADAGAEREQHRLRTQSGDGNRCSGSKQFDRCSFGAFGYTEDLICYGVELSTKTVPKANSRPRGRRGLDPNAILDAAFDMLSREGEANFSVRKLGLQIGVDPMTVLHHFGSKDELLRRIADRALATVELPIPSGDWRSDLRKVAASYRDLAQRHPRLFHLHFRFHATGPADHVSSEVVYRALRERRAHRRRRRRARARLLCLHPRLCLGRGRRSAPPDQRRGRGRASGARPPRLPGDPCADPGLQGARPRRCVRLVGRCLHRRGFVPV